jgi:hypothetical protein
MLQWGRRFFWLPAHAAAFVPHLKNFDPQDMALPAID